MVYSQNYQAKNLDQLAPRILVNIFSSRTEFPSSTLLEKPNTTFSESTLQDLSTLKCGL